VRRYLSLVTFAHTIFALPFALLAAVLAAGGAPPASKLLWILVAMVGARSAAMAFNRIADRGIDAVNPRTQTRDIPAGRVSVASASVFCALSAAVFVFAASRLNPLCFALSPVALLVVLGYSYTKRVTALSHVVLGLGLGIAPIGAWAAVTGAFALPPVVLGLAVLFWVAGFDVIYSLQDEAFDRAHGLFSLPARLGARRALGVSTAFHALSLVLLYAVYLLVDGGLLFGLGVVLAGAFLVRQHFLVTPGDLSRVNGAFFTANGWLSVAVFLCGAADVFLRR
jgi:4-hydroxybenzoate polyprenyltransferase